MGSGFEPLTKDRFSGNSKALNTGAQKVFSGSAESQGEQGESFEPYLIKVNTSA